MAGILFAVAAGLLVPAGWFIGSLMKRQWLPFVLGILAFTVSQVLIRLPVLSYLDVSSAKYTMWSVLHPIQFALFLGVTAALVEELARYGAMRFFMKQRQWRSGLFFGAGHGGVEAVLLLGLPAAGLLVSGAPLMSNGLYFIGGLERIFAMLLHIGLSILVLQAVRRKKPVFLLAAIGLHALVDAMVGIVPLFVPGELQLIVLEGFIGVVSIGLLMYCIRMKRKVGWN